jgi:hypothetical protein
MKKTRLTTRITESTKQTFDNLAEELDCTQAQVLEYLLSLNTPRLDKGIMLAERTVKKLLICGCEGEINTQKVRSLTGCNFNTALKVLNAYKEEIEEANGKLFPEEYFSKL